MHRRLTTTRAALAVLLLLTAQGVAAPAPRIPDGGNTIIVPEGSPLVFHGFDAEGAALFDGSATLSGTYYYGDDPDNEGTAVILIAEFVPDEASARLLPYYDRRGDMVDQVDLTNIDAFARAVIPASERRRVLKKGQSVRGHVTMVVDHYKAAIECDGTVFSAQFVSVVHTKALRAAAMPFRGC